MRNLKRVLSLSLASVMLFGMMVVGASAVQGYPDVDNEDNVEAIDVLQQVEVMVGYPEDGGFHPDSPVTRAEMMVIMAKLLELDYNYYSTTCPFTDVPEWARGYVGAAYANKVAYGRGDGIFDPNSTVTPVEASAFLMRALGYFQYSNDYADGFELATVRQGTAIDIYHGVSSSASEPMTRNQVAKMVLNALESGMVQPDGNTINLTTPDGSVLTGKVNYVFVTSNKGFATAISDTRATSMGSTNEGSIVELGEQLYDGMLKLNSRSLDDFGRPSRHWEYDGQAIGTYIKKDLLRQECTTQVTGKQLYDLLGSDTVRDYKFTITIDGVEDEKILNSNQITAKSNTGKNQYYFNKTALNRSNTNQVGGTGNGVLTQVFVDGDKKEVYIAIINTYLAKANADYNAARNEVTYTIYNATEVTEGDVKAYVKDCADATAAALNARLATVPTAKVFGEDFDIEGVKSGDISLVHVAGNEIKEFVDPEIIDETEITAFRTDTYVVAGSQIDYAHTAMYDADVLDNYVQTNMKDTLYRIYLDPYGYLIGLEEIESAKQYVFLTGVNSATENLKDQTAIGNVIFLDGTSKNVYINMKESKNAQNQSFSRAYPGSGTGYYVDKYTIGTTDYNYVLRTDTKVSALMNTWCTYSVDEDGIYVLQEVPNTPDTYNADRNKTKHGQNHMGGTYNYDGSKNTAYANDSTLYYYATGTTATPSGTTNSLPAAGAGFGGAPTVSVSAGSPYLGASTSYIKINKGNVSLNGIGGTIWTKVYGNNDTIYLSAETELLTRAHNTLTAASSTPQPAVIITGASAVATGVQDVDLEAWNAGAVLNNIEASELSAVNDGDLRYTDVSDGVYTLFDKNGYVIAAMVVGEDDSTSTSYAWVSSAEMNREALVNGKWEYSREVIIGGVAETLTELETNGTTTPDIENDTTGNANGANYDPTDYEGFSYWWKVEKKADGTVKNVYRIPSGTGTSPKYIYDIKDDTKSGTVILNQAFGMTTPTTNELYGTRTTFIDMDTNTRDNVNNVSAYYEVRVTGNTLQVEGATGQIRGFAVKDDAKIVLVKDEEIKRSDGTHIDWNYKGDIQYFTNDAKATGLTQAVNNMTDSGAFKGYIAAVLKDGRAEVVIIYDKTANEVQVGTNVNAVNINVHQYATGHLGVYWLQNDSNKRILKAAEVNAAIKNYMLKDGLAVLNVSFVADDGGTTGEATVTYSDGTADDKYIVTLYEYKFEDKDTTWYNGKPWEYPGP